MWSKVRVATVAIIISLSAACGSDTAPAEAPLPCVGDLTVTVTNPTSATPTISWTPACGANRLSVDLVDGAEGETSSYWALSSQDVFGPSLKYGTLPAGAEYLTPTLALKAGHTYHVFVGRAGGEVALLAHGTTTFSR